jgi:MoxR-like ATPase
MRIWPRNVKTALDDEKRPLIRGFGLGRDGRVYMEYKIHKNAPGRAIIAASPSPLTIYHDEGCPSAKENKPCWHMGAVIMALKVDPPVEAELVVSQVAPCQIIRDLTEEILGRPGDFELLELVEEDVPADPEAVLEVPDDAHWLTRFNLPARVLKKVLAFRENQEKILTGEQRMRIPKPKYIPSGSELISAVSALVYGVDGSRWEAPLLIGPKGSGKSTMAETLAAILMLPVNKVFGGIDINAEALLGARTLVPVEDVDIIIEAKLRVACKTAGIEPDTLIQRLKGAQMKVGFEPGIFLKAVEKGEMIIVDEINMLIPEVTSLLHGLLDWQKTLSVPGYGIIQAPPNFRLVGCMNFGYSGTKSLNEAFQDRFRSVQVPHLGSEKLAELIQNETNCRESTAVKLSEIFSSLAQGVENGDLSERVLSVRSLFRIAMEEMDGCGTLRYVAASVLTDGISDRYEADRIKDIIEAHLR